MRAYFFGNYYLSQIQQGIQSAHCIVDLINKYGFQSKYVSEWSYHHKTIILLNGGNQASLHELYQFLEHPSNPYPFDSFYEDEISLNRCLTSVGIILPEKIYEGAALLCDRRNCAKQISIEEIDRAFPFTICNQMNIPIQEEPENYTEWEVELMTRLNNYRLA